MFCRKIENKNKTDLKTETKSKTKNATTNNKLNLDKLLSLKRTAKSEDGSKKSRKAWGKQQQTHMFGFSVFPMFDSHSRLSFIRFQFYSFSIIRIAIPKFDFQIFGTFIIHASIINSSICLFSFSEIWFPISGVRFTSVWHFHKACFILCLLDFPISHL